MGSEADQPFTYSLRDAARFIGVSPSTLYRSEKAGAGPSAVNIGRRKVYLCQTLEAWLKTREAVLTRSETADLALADPSRVMSQEAGSYEATDKCAWIRERLGDR